jgi:hypothetical protein
MKSSSGKLAAGTAWARDTIIVSIMQPTTPTRRPVIDVTAPNRATATPAARPVQKPAEPIAPAVPAAPAAASPPPAKEPAEPSSALPVHEAPQEGGADNWLASQQVPEPNLEQPAADQAEKPAEAEEPALEVPIRPKPKDPSPAPVGAIVVTLFVMATLAALTVMVYLQS